MLWKIILINVIFNISPQTCSNLNFLGRLLNSVISPISTIFEPPRDPRLYYNAQEFICSNGYPVQTHKVVTEDGYILTLHRIPHGKSPEIGNFESNRVKRRTYRFHYGLSPQFRGCSNGSLGEHIRRPPVIIQHGFMVASDSWLFQGPGYDLAYILADAGYDVWLSNSRGNYYSKAHRSLDPTEPKFWDFSFHELGYYDLPAVIDYILEKTQSDQLFYVGHSMGTTMFFVLLSTRPEYNEKVKLFVGLAPAANFNSNYIPYRVKLVFNAVIQLAKGFEQSNTGELFPRWNVMPLLINAVCRKDSPFQDLCYDIGFFWAGFPSNSFLRKTLAVILSHVPAGASLKTMLHFLQSLKSTKFQQYDYGENMNLQIYSQLKPPEYDLSRITAPLSMHYSTDDYVVDSKNIDDLIKILPNVVNIQKISKFNHADYQWAHTARKLVYSNVTAIMEKF